MTSHIHHEPFPKWHPSSRHLNSIVHEYTSAWELIEEACETMWSVLGMPLSHPHYDQTLEQLGDDVLKDIGYESTKSETEIEQP